MVINIQAMIYMYSNDIHEQTNTRDSDRTWPLHVAELNYMRGGGRTIQWPTFSFLQKNKIFYSCGKQDHNTQTPKPQQRIKTYRGESVSGFRTLHSRIPLQYW